LDAKFSRISFSRVDFKSISPFAKSGSLLVVILTSQMKIVKTHGEVFSGGEYRHTFVGLDSWYNAGFLHNFN
jgi:hypothetical protein